MIEKWLEDLRNTPKEKLIRDFKRLSKKFPNGMNAIEYAKKYLGYKEENKKLSS